MRKSLVVLAVAAVTATACSGPAGSPGGGTDGTLTFAINEDPGNLFRLANNSATLDSLTAWAYDTLAYQDEQGEFQPWLAESWEESPTRVSFVLRSGVRCHDGTDLTAEVVADNYRWMLDPANASPWAGTAVPTDATIEHDDATRTITISTTQANSFLLAQIAVFPIHCRAALDDPDSVAAATNGTGLYRLTEAVPNDHYTFTRNEEYAWAPEGGNGPQDPGVPMQIVVRVVENTSTRANLLLSGELQMTAVQGADEERVGQRAQPLVDVQLLTGGFLYSQAEGSPTADERVRVALTSALDLDTLMRVQTADKGSRATAMSVFGAVCPYDAATPNLPRHDPAAAQRLLDEAGWVPGPDGARTRNGEPLSLTLVFNTRYPETAPTTELIREQLAAVGVEVVLEGSDFNVYADRVNAEGSAGAYDMIWHSANSTTPSVLAAYVSGPTPPAGSNFAAIRNPAFDALAAESATVSGQEACDVWERAEAELYGSADFVPFAMRPLITYARGVELAIPGTLIGPSVVLVEP